MVRGDSNHGDGKSGLWDTDHGDANQTTVTED